MRRKPTGEDIVRQDSRTAREARAHAARGPGVTLWLSGLSGAGKTTIARSVESALNNRGRVAYVLDGDDLRHGLNSDLGFSRPDRRENLRRVAEVAKLFTGAGAIVLCALISPYAEDRLLARQIVGSQDFILVHVDAPPGVCEARDPKGLYRRARAGDISGFTGIDSPYETPSDPEIRLQTDQESAAASADRVLDLLSRGRLAGRN